MKIAVIIVNYNASKDLRELLSNLLKYIRKQDKVFIVDNGSRKEEREEFKKIIHGHKIIIPIYSSKDLGFAGGVNLGIKKALDFDAYLLLNPDTLIEDNDFFNILEKEMEKYNADILGVLIKNFPNKNTIGFAGGFINKYTAKTVIRGKGNKDIGQYAKAELCDFVSGSCMLINKRVVNKIGFLPEDYFLYFEETEYCYHAKKTGIKIVFSPKTYVYHKVSQTIGYLSSTYLYYMIRNYRIFAVRILPKKYLIFFWFYYLFVWCLGYLFFVIKRREFNKISYIIRGLLNLSYE